MKIINSMQIERLNREPLIIKCLELSRAEWLDCLRKADQQLTDEGQEVRQDSPRLGSPSDKKSSTT